MIKRRTFIAASAGALIAPGIFAKEARLESRDWSGKRPIAYPDPNVVLVSKRFRRYVPFNTPIQRLYTGTLWCEGPAWNGVGRYLVWSDIPSNKLYRWIEDDGRTTVFRQPSHNSNGNTFDAEGRLISCQHGMRRVVRYEYDGTVSVIADRYDSKPLNSPNDVVVANDGAIWFTDPPYGIGGQYEGNPAEPELPNAIYRVDPDRGHITKVTDDIGAPNGLCFSPDQTKLYVTDTSKNKEIRAWNVDGTKLARGRTFVQLSNPVSNDRVGADGIRCDVEGNIWAAARPGVQVISPDADLIGAIDLPEICSNVCFGGAKRNRLFMTASQSLYSLRLNIRGAGLA